MECQANFTILACYHSYLNLSNQFNFVSIYFLKPSLREGFKKKIKNNYGKFHNGSGPPPLPPPGYGKKNIFFLKLDHFLRTFCKKCIFTIENPKKLLLDKQHAQF